MRGKRAMAAAGPGTLGFALAAAPLCWLLQVTAARLAASLACSPAVAILREFAVAADAMALVGALAGGFAAFASWHGLKKSERPGGNESLVFSRKQFLAMWAMMTSVWLFGAIVFNALDSIPVRACTG